MNKRSTASEDIGFKPGDRVTHVSYKEWGEGIVLSLEKNRGETYIRVDWGTGKIKDWDWGAGSKDWRNGDKISDHYPTVLKLAVRDTQLMPLTKSAIALIDHLTTHTQQLSEEHVELKSEVKKMMGDDRDRALLHLLRNTKLNCAEGETVLKEWEAEPSVTLTAIPNGIATYFLQVGEEKIKALVVQQESNQWEVFLTTDKKVDSSAILDGFKKYNMDVIKIHPFRGAVLQLTISDTGKVLVC